MTRIFDLLLKMLECNKVGYSLKANISRLNGTQTQRSYFTTKVILYLPYQAHRNLILMFKCREQFIRAQRMTVYDLENCKTLALEKSSIVSPIRLIFVVQRQQVPIFYGSI
jgi:hypothetical protein